MSETPQGPGWWVASDGKWYPPETHPSVRTDPPAQPPPVQQAPPPAGPPVQQYPQAGPPPQQYAPGQQYPPAGPPQQYAPGQQYPPAGPPQQYAPGQQYPPGAPYAPGLPPLSQLPPLPGSPYGAGPPPGSFGQQPAFATPLPPGATGVTPYQSAQPSKKTSSKGRGRTIAIVGAVVVVVVGLLVGVGLLVSSPSGAPMSTLHVVGPPEGVGDRVVLLDLTKSHQVELSAVDASSHRVVWSRPFVVDGITGGQIVAPAVVHDVVVDLAPTGGINSGQAIVTGINVENGSTVWTLPGSLSVSDAPYVCGSGSSVCVAGTVSGGSADLLIVDAADGVLVNSVPNMERAIGTNLYQTGDDAPTFTQITESGQVAWTKPVASVFGPGFDPDNGWNIDAIGSLNVGSVGPPMNGNSFDLSTYETAGFSQASGQVVWTDPGLYQCMGTLEFLTPPVLCQLHGTVTEGSSDQQPTYSGVTADLAGFNPATGAILWRQPIGDGTDLVDGDVSLLDDSHVVVTSPTGSPEVLDSANGTVTPVASGRVFWCLTFPPPYDVGPAASATQQQNEHQGTAFAGGCSADGMPVSQLPSTSPDAVGTTADGWFFWPTAHGLQARST